VYKIRNVTKSITFIIATEQIFNIEMTMTRYGRIILIIYNYKRHSSLPCLATRALNIHGMYALGISRGFAESSLHPTKRAE